MDKGWYFSRVELSVSISLNYWLRKPGWLDLANDAFYLITSAVLQCVEYH
jgi:hypothetical protein